jgi:citrate synthase
MTVHDGLEGVVAAETRLSDVDGAAGRLTIRGFAVEDMARRFSFEAAAALLWGEMFDAPPTDLAAELGAARVEVFAALPDAQDGLFALSPIEAVRALTARLRDGDEVATALRLLAAPAVFTAAATRVRDGEAPLAPDPALGHAADGLRMLRGRPASLAESAALDAYLVTICDHGLNASTFAARVVASTRAGLVSAALAGISALKGPLHGGAPGPVLDMFDAIGTPERARPWLEAALDRGDRLMGFGHRVYRVRDPRADALKGVIRRLNQEGGTPAGRLDFVEAVESAALAILRERKPDRPLDVNVELYTALLLEALAFPRETFTCVFAMGRMAGWIAHAREQVLGGRLIRPASVYIGPLPGKAA